MRAHHGCINFDFIMAGKHKHEIQNLQNQRA
jgi:hypothetical protein